MGTSTTRLDFGIPAWLSDKLVANGETRQIREVVIRFRCEEYALIKIVFHPTEGFPFGDGRDVKYFTLVEVEP